MIKKQEEIIDDYQWEMSRKDFLSSLLAVGAVASLSFLTSCETKESKEVSRDFDCSPLSKNQLKVLQAFQLILFPEEGRGPSALDVNADKWFVYTLNEKRVPQRDKDFFTEHLNGLNDFSKEKHAKSFDTLSRLKQEELVALFFENGTQKRWGSRMLSLIFEALLLDPIYGVNPDKVGWKWLGHNPGLPRPTAETKYPEIYNTIGDV